MHNMLCRPFSMTRTSAGMRRRAFPQWQDGTGNHTILTLKYGSPCGLICAILRFRPWRAAARNASFASAGTNHSRNPFSGFSGRPVSAQIPGVFTMRLWGSRPAGDGRRTGAPFLLHGIAAFLYLSPFPPPFPRPSPSSSLTI